MNKYRNKINNNPHMLIIFHINYQNTNIQPNRRHTGEYYPQRLILHKFTSHNPDRMKKKPTSARGRPKRLPTYRLLAAFLSALRTARRHWTSAEESNATSPYVSPLRMTVITLCQYKPRPCQKKFRSMQQNETSVHL
mgnify:CR=1 FL=1